MKIYWATRLRGFLKHVNNVSKKIEFCNEQTYEVNGIKQKILSKLIRNPIFNYIGLFQISNISKKDCNYYASFNRFLKTDKPYFIYLENPTALYHYSINRIKYSAGKKRYESCINNPNFRGFICMSKKCRDTYEIINGKLPKRIKLTNIYPLVPNNSNINKKLINEKSKNNIVELLYCVQGVRFISKGGLEILKAVEDIDNVHLTIITKISDVDKKTLKLIKSNKKVTLYDFNFTYEELEKIYAKANILLQPTSDESFGMTILEAMNGGCAIIASNLYAIPEMVEDGYNGFLIEPKYYFFDKEGIPNPKVWNHRKKTIFSKKTSPRLINDIKEKIEILVKDRNLLNTFCINSYTRAMDNNYFGEAGIKKQWEDFIDQLDKTNN